MDDKVHLGEITLQGEFDGQRGTLWATIDPTVEPGDPCWQVVCELPDGSMQGTNHALQNTPTECRGVAAIAWAADRWELVLDD